ARAGPRAFVAASGRGRARGARLPGAAPPRRLAVPARGDPRRGPAPPARPPGAGGGRPVGRPPHPPGRGGGPPRPAPRPPARPAACSAASLPVAFAEASGGVLERMKAAGVAVTDFAFSTVDEACGVIGSGAPPSSG